MIKHLLPGIIMTIILALLTAININQTWRYRQLERALGQLERTQNYLYEDNKRLLATITELEAPERLLSLVEEHPEWQLRSLSPQDLILVKKQED